MISKFIHKQSTTTPLTRILNLQRAVPASAVTRSDSPSHSLSDSISHTLSHTPSGPESVLHSVRNPIQHLIRNAGFSFGVAPVLVTSLLLGLLAAWILLLFLSPLFAPVFFLVGFLTPLAFIRKRAAARALEFTADLPTVLLAAASSLRVGMTPLIALERSVKLLPAKNLVRHEVELLTRRLNQGSPKELAIGRFGEDIDAPDIELFRSALLLATEHGGRFGPTLEKLALSCKERLTLIRSARVTTSIMNMTANCLLLITPVVIGLVASRSENFLETFRNNPTANMLGTLGSIMIIGGYLTLRKMSAFRP